MNERIEYLKTVVFANTPDIAAFKELDKKEYLEFSAGEIKRKSHFLNSFAENIPVVIDEKELIIGSMRFWHSGVSARNVGHIIVDFETILKLGIIGIKEKIAIFEGETADALRESVFAFEKFILRYANAAEEKGMYSVAENCRNLVVFAPKTFYEALQLVWFVHLFLHAEGVSAAVSFGRFDCYMYPFYKRDIENGVISEEELRELLMCFWLKTCEGDESQNLTVGGDTENELTFLCLDITAELKVKQPSVSVRICENSSEKLMDKTLKVIKCKTGMPAIFNDKTVISALRNAKVEPKDAENYGIVGCYEANSAGNTFGTTACAGKFYLHDIMVAFLKQNNDYCEFSAFYSAFTEFLKDTYNGEILNEFRNNWQDIRNKLISPFQSVCMGDCLENGVPCELGGCKYTMAGINILGIGTLVDSIYAIKKLVFEEKAITFKDFTFQVLNNFPNKQLSKKCKNLKGKYGTDNDETNRLASELSLFIARLIENGEIHDGVTAYAGLFVFLHDVNSENYPATPDGRLKGERISYGVGASDFCEGKTVTSVINSATNIANHCFADGNPLMFNIAESQIVGEKGDLMLKSLIKSYFEKGGFHLQFNITDANTLKDAQKNPQNYSDLIVRISGYSEYFTKLDIGVQNALIERS